MDDPKIQALWSWARISYFCRNIGDGSSDLFWAFHFGGVERNAHAVSCSGPIFSSSSWGRFDKLLALHGNAPPKPLFCKAARHGRAKTQARRGVRRLLPRRLAFYRKPNKKRAGWALIMLGYQMFAAPGIDPVSCSASRSHKTFPNLTTAALLTNILVISSRTYLRGSLTSKSTASLDIN